MKSAQNWPRIVLISTAAVALALTFALYLRPSFLFDITNQILIWCG
jgi:uncharacterized protein involved in exopolysaccharide biosynthesis